MRLPFLTTFLLFIIVLTIALKRTDKYEEKIEENFWAKEHKANFTRKKDIEHLDYIQLDPSSLPLHSEIDDISLQEYIQEIHSLSGKRILNCTGISNTDLKLQYGAPNITKLTEYDQNYTTLVRAISRIAERYLDYSRASENNNTENASLRADAVTLLEYGIEIDTDVRLNYELLGEIYAQSGQFDKIEQLKTKAMTLNSLSKNPIIRSLDKLLEKKG